MNSPDHGWKRAFSAYSPSSSIFNSPIIQTEGKVKPTITQDQTTVTKTWILSTAEENYYQNFIELLTLKKYKGELINQTLRINRINMYWPERLIDFYTLGKGAFGIVYRSKDRYTGNLYAVKEVTSYTPKEGQLLSKTLNIMTERSAFVRSNDSPFIVKLHGAFQDAGLRSYWLVFEFCIGDLKVYLKFIKPQILLYLDKMLTANVLSPFYNAFKRFLNLDIEVIGCILGFEILAGLDYLARRNLLHNDLKPDNILICSTGHLKISDLGLTQRVKWSDRRSAVHLVQPSALKELQKTDFQQCRVGNLRYTDPESLIYNGELMEPSEFYNQYTHPGLPITNGDQNFLTDLYGGALIMMDLIFLYMNPVTTRHLSLRLKNEYEVFTTSEINMFSIRCVYDLEVHTNYFLKIMNNQYTESNRSIIDFLKSCFKSRNQRAISYTSKINTRRMKWVDKSRCIDIGRVEEMEYYKRLNITQFNVCNYKMSGAFLKVYLEQWESKDIEADDFQELLNSKPSRTNQGEQEIRMTAFELAL